MKAVQHKLTVKDIQPLYRQLINAKWDEYKEQPRQEILKEIIQIVEELNIKEVSLHYQISDCWDDDNCKKAERTHNVKLDDKCPKAKDILHSKFAKMDDEAWNEIKDECYPSDKKPHNIDVTMRKLLSNTKNDQVALLYPIVLGDKLLLLWLEKKSANSYNIQAHEVLINQTILDAILLEFRFKMMRKLDDEHKILARFLYQEMIKPFEAALERTDTLIVIPTGYFRMIPLEVLVKPEKNKDDEQYLIERENLGIAYTVAASQFDFEKYKKKSHTALIAGTSASPEHEDFGTLEIVKQELADIKKTFDENTQYIKQAFTLREELFTKQKIKDRVRLSTPEIIHLASHSGFYSNPKDSFILTHDAARNNNLSLSTNDLEIMVSPVVDKKYEIAKHQVELLVLSACETAYGDEDSALGLAGITVKSGAKSAIASLWAVEDDRSIPTLMTTFYQNYLAGDSKAKALQKAKLALIQDGEYYQRYPFYWAPFILIGDWQRIPVE